MQVSKDSLQHDLFDMQRMLDKKDQEVSAAIYGGAGGADSHFGSLRGDFQHDTWRHSGMEEEEEEGEYDGIRSNHSQTESDFLNPRVASSSCHLEYAAGKVAGVEEDERWAWLVAILQIFYNFFFPL